MLEHTLIVVLSEFGRTPNINLHYGRDHWSKAWSVVVAGGRIPRGHVHGRTNDNGTAVADGQVDHANLFHTYLQALGIDSTENFTIDGRPMPIADPASAPIKELLTCSAVEMDVKQTHVAKTLTHGAPLIACRFDPAGKFVFASSQDRTLQRRNLSRRRQGWICRPRKLDLRHRFCGRRSHRSHGRR